MYDYSTEKEALEHKEEMLKKGCSVKTDIYKNGGDEYKYTIEYQK